MDENENPDFTTKHNFQSNFKEISNKNFNFTSTQPQEANFSNNNPIRTPLKDKLFNFNLINSKTPLSKNLLKSQMVNKIQVNKFNQNQQEIKFQIKESKKNKNFNFQDSNAKDYLISEEKTENKTKTFFNLKEKLQLHSKNEIEINASVKFSNKEIHSDIDSNIGNE
jgi:hypothetical protein